MSLDIQQHDREGVVVLGMKGRIVVGKEATALRDKMTELTNSGQKNLVFNLAGVDFIDSTGLGALVMCSTSMRRNGGNVKLVNLNKRNIELLVMTRLATAFEIFTDEQDAVNSFFPEREIKRFDILSFVQQERERE
jgi:anti-sigma B factor antagonist